MTSKIKNPTEYPLSLSVKNVAEIMGISLQKAYEVVHVDGFPSIQIGEKRIVIPRDGFFAWFNNVRVGNKDDKAVS